MAVVTALPVIGILADIDAAEDHVHLLFYLWLADNNGCKVVEALQRTVRRGVTCRAMVDDLLQQPLCAPQQGFPAQVIGTGPTVRYSAMPEMFESLVYSARRELVISTPYYVPTNGAQSGSFPAAS